MNKTTTRSQRILVTGGAGFIGSHLVTSLVARGDLVTVADSLNTGRLEHLASVRSAIQFIEGDLQTLLAEGTVDVRAYDTVFHLAANAYIPPSVENPAFDFASNAATTFALLDTVRRVAHQTHIVNVSSAAVYGSPVRLPIAEDAPLAPISPYGVSKLTGERYAAVFAQLYEVRASSVRLFSVYGPRQRKQVVYDLLVRLRADPQSLTVLGDGSQERDFTHVDDVVAALIFVADNAPARGETYNVASGASYSIRELVQAWCRVLDVNPTLTFTGSTRPGDAERWRVDISALIQLGYTPQMPLDRGLESVRAWFDSLANQESPTHETFTGKGAATVIPNRR